MLFTSKSEKIMGLRPRRSASGLAPPIASCATPDLLASTSPEVASWGGSNGKEADCQFRRHKRCRLNPWIRKIPWRRAQHHTSVFLPGESHGQRSLVGYSPYNLKESDTTQEHTHTKSKKRMVVWVQSECKYVGCLLSWSQGWPGAQLTAVAQNHQGILYHMLLAWGKITFKNSKYGFYFLLKVHHFLATVR